ncbi:hypothetical protein PybrP1_011699, partial [[Pythium] brassicae (nom. inval.)]
CTLGSKCASSTPPHRATSVGSGSASARTHHLAMVFLCCSAGELVKTFELSSEDVQLRCTMGSLNAEVTCARYNHNGKILASCSVDGGICLDVASSGELLSRFFAPAKSVGQRIWDLKTQEVTQTYSISASAVTSVAFCGYKDECIVAGSESGAISVCDVRSADTAGFLAVDPKYGVYKVAGIQNSPHPYARHTLGATYGDGSVRVWDLTAGLLTSEFVRHHDAAATSLAISPVSKVLLATGGLDGRVCFFDTAQGKELRSLDFDHPVSSLALCADGKTLAVGTTAGEILIYDLRGAITPLYSTCAHDEAAVNSLQFATPSAESSAASVFPQGVPVISREYQPQQLQSTSASSPPPSPGRATRETLQEIATRKLEALGMGSARASPPHSPTVSKWLQGSSTRQSMVSSPTNHAHSLFQQATASSPPVEQMPPDEHSARPESPEPSLLSRFSPSRSRLSAPGSPRPGRLVPKDEAQLSQSGAVTNAADTTTQRQEREYRANHDIRERIRFVRHELEVQHRTTFDHISEVLEELLCSYEVLLTENTQLRRENDELKAPTSRPGG